MREYVFVFLTALVTTYVLVPLLRTVAIRVGAFTEVRERDVHAVVDKHPRLGADLVDGGRDLARECHHRVGRRDVVAEHLDRPVVLLEGEVYTLRPRDRAELLDDVGRRAARVPHQRVEVRDVHDGDVVAVGQRVPRRRHVAVRREG